MNVLLVENNAPYRESLRMLLESENHQCTEASDGKKAIELLLQNPHFDLLMTDFRMPNCDGVELLDWCREKEIHFPVIFMTSGSELFEREKLALNDCCADLLRKPFHIDELVKAINAAEKRNHARSCFDK